MKAFILISSWIATIMICDYSVALANSPDDPLQYVKALPRVYIGFTGGYGRIFHSEGISNPLNNQNFESARNGSFFLGLCGEYIIGKRLNTGEDPPSSILLKAYYLNFSTAQSTFSESKSFLTPGGQQTTAKFQNTANFKASFINTELLYFYDLFSTIFSVGGGVGAAFPLSSSIEKRKEILKPANVALTTDDVRYKSEQNGRALVFKENDIAKINYYTKIGIQSDLYLFKINVSPSIFYNFGLNKATNTEDFKINALQCGVDFKFDL